MIIETLKLKDFRNYEALTLTPHPGVNLLFGQNGSGKTNLLEAVHYCALGRSHRTSQDKEVVRKGAEAAAVGVVVRKADGRHDTAVKLTPNEIRKKQVFLDGKRAARLSDMMGRLQCVIFSPEDLMLIKDGPSVRRRFLDMMLSQLSTSYFVALQQYQKAMEQRNSLLRDVRKGARLDRAMLEAFEQGMAAPCDIIIRERRKMLDILSDCATGKYEQISGRPGETFLMNYECCLDSDDNIPERIMQGLSQSRTEDIYRGTSGFGIHREDISLTLMDRDMKLLESMATEGNVRSLIEAVKADCAEGNMAQSYMYHTGHFRIEDEYAEKGYHEVGAINISVGSEDYNWWIGVYPESVHTLRWLENHGLLNAEIRPENLRY